MTFSGFVWLACVSVHVVFLLTKALLSYAVRLVVLGVVLVLGQGGRKAGKGMGGGCTKGIQSNQDTFFIYTDTDNSSEAAAALPVGGVRMGSLCTHGPWEVERYSFRRRSRSKRECRYKTLPCKKRNGAHFSFPPHLGGGGWVSCPVPCRREARKGLEKRASAARSHAGALWCVAFRHIASSIMPLSVPLPPPHTPAHPHPHQPTHSPPALYKPEPAKHHARSYRRFPPCLGATGRQQTSRFPPLPLPPRRRRHAQTRAGLGRGTLLLLCGVGGLVGGCIICLSAACLRAPPAHGCASSLSCPALPLLPPHTPTSNTKNTHSPPPRNSTTPRPSLSRTSPRPCFASATASSARLATRSVPPTHPPTHPTHPCTPAHLIQIAVSSSTHPPTYPPTHPPLPYSPISSRTSARPTSSSRPSSPNSPALSRSVGPGTPSSF